MRLVSHGLTVLLAGLALVSGALAEDDSNNNTNTNNNATCDPLFGRIDAGKGGRKVGIVIDASGSMEDTDPDNLRLSAAKQLADKLISPAEAGGDKTADEVTVIKFTHSAQVLYPLGDPDKAGPAIDGISALGGTFIGSGIQAAIKELTKPSAGTTAGRTGILVLTDGVDDPASYTKETVAAINRAASLGIRVSFGFLSIDSTRQDSDITEAIINSGGTFSTIKVPSDTAKVAAQVLMNGLVGEPSNTTITLLPGLDTAGLLNQTGANTFSYEAKAGETFNLTLTAIDPITIKVTLKDPSGNEIASAVTDDSGVAVVEYIAKDDVTITVEVTAETGNASGLFSVAISSSLDPCVEEPDTDDEDEEDDTSSYGSYIPSITSFIPSSTQPTVVPTPTSTAVATAAATALRDANLGLGLGLMLIPAVLGVVN